MAKKKPDPSIPDAEVARWKTEIQLYDRDAEPWITQGKKIVRRYKDHRQPNDTKARFNILWSNVQTLQPALFAKNPKPDIERRFQDDDDLGRVASDVLERSTSYFVDEKFFECVNQCVLDRLLPGRGTVWVRYVPHFKDKTIEGDEEIQDEGTQATDDIEQEAEELSYEEVCVDYVPWEDFGHTWARTWEEVRGAWRIVYMTRDELVSRFGPEGKKVPLDYTPKTLSDEKVNDQVKKATIYEIWDKSNKEVLWMHKDYPRLLDQRDDPLHLKEFFPFPKPLFATLANDTIIPVPDYKEYQDQAEELDTLTGRIKALTKALKIAGVYDASADGIQRLLVEGNENVLIPIDQWAALAEKGGVAGVMSFIPIKEIGATLLGLYEARDKVKQDLYEITGISDIIRGQTDPNETLGAQELKGKFASLRIDAKQREVASFCRDLVRICAELISEHFSIETIKEISGVKLLTQAEKQLLMSIPAPPQGQPPQIPPNMPPELQKLMGDTDRLQELMEDPSWEEVDALLKNDALRCFRIDIETDSTIKQDQDAEKASRVELITAIGGYIEQASMVQDPALKPFLAQVLGFGLRGFHVGKELESSYKMAMKKIEKESENPQPKPDPEVQKAQMQIQADQQNKTMEVQANQQQAQTDAQLEMTKMQNEAQLKQLEFAQEIKLKEMELGAQMQIEKYKVDNSNVIEREKMKSSEKQARFSASTKGSADTELAADDAGLATPDDAPSKLDNISGSQDQILQAILGSQKLMEQQIQHLETTANGIQQAVAAANAKKIVKRDKSGRVTGVEIDRGSVN